MKTYLDCFPCFVEQAVRAARLVTDDETVIKQILDEVGSHFSQFPYPRLRPRPVNLFIEESGRLVGWMIRFSTSIRLATLGNVLDFGIKKEYKRNTPFSIKALREHLERASSVLYIGDNAGESVFDRLLIGQLQKPVTYIIRTNHLSSTMPPWTMPLIPDLQMWQI